MITLASAPNPPPRPKDLDQQGTDFTAEGAPPPGKVATGVPVTVEQARNDAQPTPPGPVAPTGARSSG